MNEYPSYDEEGFRQPDPVSDSGAISRDGSTFTIRHGIPPGLSGAEEHGSFRGKKRGEFPPLFLTHE
jgi:hypothetical protein